MGIAGNVMEGLVREAKFRPFAGTAYTLGRQTMAMTPFQVNDMFHRLGLAPVGGEADLRRVDTVTLESRNRAEKPIRDADFFRMLGFSEVKAIDVSDFEGAEIILDLNRPPPAELAGSCDLLIDGSTLDNVFDPVTALRNAVRFLRPDGRMFLMNLGGYSPHYNGIPYLMFTPIWFYDFFCINEFADCQVFVSIYEPDGDATFLLSHDCTTRRADDGLVKPVFSEHPIQITVFAERAAHSTWDRTPTQHAYRGRAEWEAFEHNVRRFAERRRPPLLRTIGPTRTPYRPAPGWLFCNRDGSLSDPHRPSP